MKRLFVILGVVGVSFSAVLVRWSTAPSMVLACYRMLMAAAMLAPAVLLRERNGLRALDGKTAVLCMVSGVFLGLHFAAYFESLRFTSIASAVVLVDTEVLFVALGSRLILKKRMPAKAWLAVALALGGSAVIAAGDTAAGTNALRGDMIALSGALFMAVYTVIGAVCRKYLSTTLYTFLVYFFAGVTVLCIALAGGTPLFGYGAVNYAAALAMAVFCTLLGHSVFSWGLRYLPAAFISTAKLLEPVFAAVWGVLIFSEMPGVQTVLGGAVVLLGVALYGRIAGRET